MKFIYIFLIYLVIDYFYLNLEINKKMYSSLVKNIQKDNLQLNLIYTIFSYLVMTISFSYFVKTERDALMIGFSLYGLWNTVNGAIFKDWSLEVSIKDTLWGITLNFIVFKILKLLKIKL